MHKQRVGIITFPQRMSSDTYFIEIRVLDYSSRGEGNWRRNSLPPNPETKNPKVR